MLNEWFIPIGAATPDGSAMDFNYFTFNGRVYPGTDSLVAKKGDHVRIRFGNLSMNNHPIHIHGLEFIVTRRGGKRLPETAQYSEVTVDVPVGATRDIEFIADNLGDWAVHCHKTHHTMSGMAHGLPNMINTQQQNVEAKIRTLIPEYMPMGVSGMGEMYEGHHHKMPKPKNYLPYGSPGPHGTIEMSGMFTVLKIREHLTNYNDPGWYQMPDKKEIDLFRN